MTAIKNDTPLKGLSLSSGIALAGACLFNENRHSNLPIYKVIGSGREKEMGRFERAVSLVKERLNLIATDVQEKIGEAEANIFLAQRMILTDKTLAAEISDAILKEGRNAEVAVSQVLDTYENKISAIDTRTSGNGLRTSVRSKDGCWMFCVI